MGLLQGGHTPPRTQYRSHLLSPPQSSKLPGSRLWTSVPPRAPISPSPLNRNVKEGHVLNKEIPNNSPLLYSSEFEEGDFKEENTPCSTRGMNSKSTQAFGPEIDDDNVNSASETTEPEIHRSQVASALFPKAKASSLLANGNSQLFNQEFRLHNRSSSVQDALSALRDPRLDSMKNSANTFSKTSNVDLEDAFPHPFMKFKAHRSKTLQVGLKHFGERDQEFLVPLTVKQNHRIKPLIVRETNPSPDYEDTEIKDLISHDLHGHFNLSEPGNSSIISSSQSSDDDAIARLFEALERDSPISSKVVEWERQARTEVDDIYDAHFAHVQLAALNVNVEVMKVRRAKIVEELSRDYHEEMSKIYDGFRKAWHEERFKTSGRNFAEHDENERRRSKRARFASNFPRPSIEYVSEEDEFLYPAIVLNRSGGNHVSFIRESAPSRELLSLDETTGSASTSPTQVSSHNDPSSPEWTPTTQRKKVDKRVKSLFTASRGKTKSTKIGEKSTAFDNDNPRRSPASDLPADHDVTHLNSLLFSHYTQTSLPASYNEPPKPKSGRRYLPVTNARNIAFNAALDVFQAKHTVGASEHKSSTPSSPVACATLDIGDGECNTTWMGVDSDPEAEDDSAADWDEEQRGPRYANAILMGVLSGDESEDERPPVVERRWGFDALWPKPEEVSGEVRRMITLR